MPAKIGEAYRSSTQGSMGRGLPILFGLHTTPKENLRRHLFSKKGGESLRTVDVIHEGTVRSEPLCTVEAQAGEHLQIHNRMKSQTPF